MLHFSLNMGCARRWDLWSSYREWTNRQLTGFCWHNTANIVL